MFVFPMAGLSRRFSDAGYHLPKYMLTAHRRPLFDFAVIGFSAYFEKESFLFIYRDIHNTESFLRERCSILGIPIDRCHFVALDGPTSGQAETVAMGLAKVKVSASESLMIFNIDTFRHHFLYPSCFNISKIDGYLEVFKGEGNQWSFVEPSEDIGGKRVKRVTEKERISNYCSTGLYYFREVGQFMQAYFESCSIGINQLQGGERYVAPLYNSMICRGSDIRFDLISSENVTFCGTPIEYGEFLHMDAMRVAMIC
jgi:hypothetical protein